MEIELIEIREFLAGHAPFSALPDSSLDDLPRRLSVRYLRRGSPVPPADANGEYLYLVRSGAIELRDVHDELIEKFAEGEFYAPTCADAIDPGCNAHTVEDTLLYLLPCNEVRRLRENHAEFRDHFGQTTEQRLRHALQTLRSTPLRGTGLLAGRVADAIRRPVVMISPSASLREAAQLMNAERVSCLLVVTQDTLIGILTDRDLRSRGVAQGLDGTAVISAIMSGHVVTTTAETPLFEAFLLMTRHAIHHLPICEEGRPLGVITSTDLIRLQGANALYLSNDLRRCDDRTALAATARRLPELQVQLLGSGVTASHLGRAVAAVADTLTRRLLELAEQRFGPPPIPYLWLASGSQARREQMAHSDQDNALLLDDHYDAQHHGEYFEQLARFVCDGLHEAGLRYCPGEVMACNESWRQPVQAWRRYFHRWITQPERKSVMLACNFFDLRPIAGEFGLYESLHAEVRDEARDNKLFHAYLAANAVHNRPPLGFFRNIVMINEGEHANTLDLKRSGILPIVDLARVYAITAGVGEISTGERLDAAREAGSVSSEGGTELKEAMEFISTLRARHQVEQIRRGETPDNYVDPAALSALERRHLRDVFVIITTMQKALAQRYQTERFA